MEINDIINTKSPMGYSKGTVKSKYTDASGTIYGIRDDFTSRFIESSNVTFKDGEFWEI